MDPTWPLDMGQVKVAFCLYLYDQEPADFPLENLKFIFAQSSTCPKENEYVLVDGAVTHAVTTRRPPLPLHPHPYPPHGQE